MKKFFKSYISNILFIFFVFFFALFLYNNQDEMKSLLEFSYLNLSSLIIFFFFSYLCKTKLNQILYSLKNIEMSFTETLNLVINSTAGNLSTPFSLGTGYKFHYLKQKYKISYTENLNLNIYLSIFTNLLFVIILFFISISYFLNISEVFLKFTILWGLIVLFGIILLLLLSKIYTNKHLLFINKYSLKSLSLSFKKIVDLFIYTVVLIAINIGTHYYLFQILNFDIDFLQIASYVSLSGVANIIKFTPGNFGINEGVLILTNLYHGLTTIQILITSLIFRFFSWLNILFIYAVLNIQKSKN